MTKAKPIAGMRSALKWAGGKKKIVSDIASLLPKKGKKRLVEPFVGGGSVFLNLDFDEYLLIDMNKDLINLFNIIKNQPTEFIIDAEKLFISDNNQSEKYEEGRNHHAHKTILILRWGWHWSAVKVTF